VKEAAAAAIVEKKVADKLAKAQLGARGGDAVEGDEGTAEREEGEGWAGVESGRGSDPSRRKRILLP
jgi:hypothetical protein